MSEKKKEVGSDVIMADVMLRLTALEKLLIDKKVIEQEEFFQTMEEIAKKVSQVILEKAKTFTAEQPMVLPTDISKN